MGRIEAARGGSSTIKVDKIKSNKAASCWEVFVSKGELDDPKWSDRTFKEMFDSAFSDKIIRDVSHPVIKRQQGM